MTSIETTDKDDNQVPYPVTSSSKILITYGKRGGGNMDVITLTYDSTNYTITITDDNPKHPVAKSPQMLLNLRTHPRRDWKITKIVVYPDGGDAKPDVVCGDDSECSVVVRTMPK